MPAVPATGMVPMMTMPAMAVVPPMAMMPTMAMPATVPDLLHVADIRRSRRFGHPHAAHGHGLSRRVGGEKGRARPEQGHGNKLPHGSISFLWLVPGDAQNLLRLRGVPDHINNPTAYG